MSIDRANIHHAGHRHEEGGFGHATRRTYLVGFALAAVLTAAPFWAALGGAQWGTLAVSLVIFGTALAQMVVHAVYFLHLDTRSEGGWTLIAFVFTAVFVAITVAGSIWIMYHLNANMMPMGPPGTMSETM